MKIEIWSDYMCPFCYIGYRQLNSAIEAFAHKDQIELQHRAYELDPRQPLYVRTNAAEHLAAKYGRTVEDVKPMMERVANMAKLIGLEYNMDTMVQTNSSIAHRLSQYAEPFGKRHAITERLFRAVFTDSLFIGDHQVLADIAAAVGLDREETLRVLATDDYQDAVIADRKEAYELGINGVPYMLVDRKHVIYGAQPSATMLDVIEQAWNERNEKL